MLGFLLITAVCVVGDCGEMNSVDSYHYYHQSIWTERHDR